MVEKLVRDGQVAVLISPGFGAGWSTWASDKEEKNFLLFDKTLAQLVLDGLRVSDYVSSKFPDIYLGGASDLTVVWLPEGTAFQIEEYDGSESIATQESLTHVA